MKTIKEIFNDFITRRLNQEEIYDLSAEVLSIESENRTCTVKTARDAETISGVSLAAYPGAPFGLFITPRPGSQVMVGFYTKDEAYLSKVSLLEKIEIIYNNGTTIEIDENEIIFNQGTLEGLVTINELTEKLNALVNEVNTIYTELKSHTHTSGGAGSPTTAPVPPLTSPDASSFNKSDYENEKIKQ